MDFVGWKDVALAACGLLSLLSVGISGWVLLAIVAFGNRLTAVETRESSASQEIDRRFTEIGKKLDEIMGFLRERK